MGTSREGSLLFIPPYLFRRGAFREGSKLCVPPYGRRSTLELRTSRKGSMLLVPPLGRRNTLELLKRHVEVGAYGDKVLETRGDSVLKACDDEVS